MSARAALQEPAPAPSGSLTELSLEDLMNIEVEVTSVARKSQPVSETTAAIYVLTNEDLRRSGALSIPEALRMVPGIEVARLDSNTWAITSRGFNDQFANKMLVLIDGRSAYTPLFSGVLWSIQDVPLEDVERIEVIRGPGAVQWGANAVNGVINIITKSASDTQGTLLTTGVGNEEHSFTYVRQGGRIGERGHYRVWAKYGDHGELQSTSGGGGNDDWNLGHGGFRIDVPSSSNDSFTLQGDAYSGVAHNEVRLAAPPPVYLMSGRNRSELSGGNLLGRWTRTLGESSNLSLQVYYDHSDFETDDLLGEVRDTLDLDFQHRFSPAARHDVVWGLGARHSHAEYDNSFVVSIDPDTRSDLLLSAFAQDEITLRQDLRLTVGAKVEHTDQTGVEFQPSVRMLWKQDERQTWWGAVSRALRTPSVTNEDSSVILAVIPGAPDTFVEYFGNDDVRSEELTAFELGYRLQPTDHVSLDCTAFYNIYDHLQASEPGAPFMQGGNLIMPLFASNALSAETYGVEAAVEWMQREDLRWNFAVSLLEIDMDAGDSLDPNADAVEGNSPAAMLSLFVNHDLTRDVDVDAAAYYVDSLDGADIPSYLRLDLRLEWRPSKGTSLIAGAQGLFHDGEREFGDSFFNVANEVEQSAYLKAVWKF